MKGRRVEEIISARGGFRDDGGTRPRTKVGSLARESKLDNLKSNLYDLLPSLNRTKWITVPSGSSSFNLIRNRVLPSRINRVNAVVKLVINASS